MTFAGRAFCFSWINRLVLACAIGLVPGAAFAQGNTGVALEDVTRQADIVWMLVTAALVMMMQVGFMLLEAGMVRSKNSINVAQKNLLDFVFSVLMFGGNKKGPPLSI